MPARQIKLRVAAIVPLLGMLVAGAAVAENIAVGNYGSSANGMPFAVALEKGYFQQEGANVTGQSCNSTSRVYLHTDIHDATLPEIVKRVAAIRIGLPTERDTEMSCLASQAQFDKTISYIKLGLDGGARLAYGGKRPADPKLTRGFFVEPTVFADVTDDMRIAREEIFGPVVSILRWSDESDLISRVNALDVGLTASIWTHDLDRAHRLASRVEAGYVWINGASTHHVGVPFGGVKQSGLGREE